jgi:hypothetical protein
MIVGVVNHTSNSGAEEFLDKLDRSMGIIKREGFDVDILIGPDYSLVTKDAMAANRPNTMGERYSILSDVKSISKSLPSTVIIPGTMFWHQKNKQESIDDVFLSAPAYKNGHLVAELFKERDNGEAPSAERYGNLIGKKAVYKRGNSKNNFMTIRGNRVAIEICGDHGNQDAKGVDLEIIMAYDNKAGFYITAANNNWNRYAVLCDGYSGTDSAQYFDTEKGILGACYPCIPGIESGEVIAQKFYNGLYRDVNIYDLKLLKKKPVKGEIITV